MPYSHLPLTVLVVDDDAGIRSSLRRLLKLDGYTVDEAASVAELFDREDWSKYFAILLDRRLPDGTTDDVLPRLAEVAPDTAILVVTAHADVDGSIAALRAGAADYLLKPVEPTVLQARLRGLASLWRTRAAVAERDAQLEFMVEHLPAAAAYVDFNRQRVRFNQVVQTVTGYSAEELSTLDDCFEKLFPQHVELARRMYLRNRQRWSDQVLSLEVIHKLGEPRTLEFRGYRYDDHEVWLLQDVTERQRHETELRIRDRAIQSTSEGIVIANARQPGNPIVFVNEAFSRITGYAWDEAIGRACEVLCGDDPDTSALSRLKAAVSDGAEFRVTVPCFRKDGTRFWNKLSVAPIPDVDGRVTHLVAVMEDVSERRQAEQQLLQSERLAAIGQMVTGLAHESRNALQRAQACLDMLSLDLEDQPEQLELTEKTRRALTDLYRHYEEVRNYAAPIVLEKRPTDLVRLIRSTWADLEADHRERTFAFHVADHGVPQTLSVDEHRLRQVFLNLMENALAACQDPGRLEVTCERIDGDRSMCRVTFCDNGPGFDVSTAAAAFQPFFTTKQKGTGLGMAICKRIIDAHDGHIGIPSDVVGGCIVVEIPCDETGSPR